VTNLLPDWTQSLKEAIGQMVVVRASGYLFDRQIRYPAWEPPAEKLRYWLQTLNLGGVILLGGSAAEISLRSQQLQSWSATPLLIGADIEEGVGQRFAGATWFPPPMALGAIAKRDLAQAKAYAAQMGAAIAKEALAVGINWIYAPVADVNNNPDNPVINVRAFGDTPEVVGELVSAFIEGAKPYCVLTCAKHFPGHGDTATDSHLDLPILPHSPSRLEQIELAPFKRAIAAGVDSVMSAHLLIPEWDAQRPATLSGAILTGQLRQQLGFEGLIVTDALIMGGITRYASPEDVAVMAVEAGTDVLLMPSDPEVAIAAVYQAVQSGRIPAQRIRESVAKIWRAKERVFGDRALVNSEPLSFLSQVAQPDAIATADDILKASLQKGGALPLQPLLGEAGRNLIVVDDLLNCSFLDRHTPAVTIPKQFGYEIQLIDQNSLDVVTSDSRATLLQVFIRANPFKGIAGLSLKAQAFYRNLLEKSSIQGVIIYGSPYILEWFQSLLSPNVAWIFSYGQIEAAQAIATSIMFDLERVSLVQKDTTFVDD
jgi:beta-glucosidase